MTETEIIEAFQKIYYDNSHRTWGNTFFLGVPVQKCPCDLWVYQEIIFETVPDVIIETGTFAGGSALFLASVCELLNHGRVLTIDVNIPPNLVKHRRLEFLNGSSTNSYIIDSVKSSLNSNDSVMVILDSDHAMDHVLQELNIFSCLVSPGSYLIVEDTNINGHPVLSDYGPGPMEAVDFFLNNNNQFMRDESREKFLMTFNPKGYLKRKA